MQNKTRQVFQTDKPTRWKRFQWLFRSLLVLFILLSVTFTISLIGHQRVVKLPEAEIKKTVLKKLTKEELDASYSPQSKKEFKSDIQKIRKLHKDHDLYEKKMALPSNREIEYPIRAGFYVNWDPQSRFSLEYNASELNMVLPEWCFVTDSTDEVAVKVDSVALNIMRKEKLVIVPMISNIFKGAFNGKNVNRIISSPRRRSTFIASVVRMLDKYKFQGVNIDFENLEDFTRRSDVVAFQTELYKALHEKKYIVTQDIQPFNEAYDLKQLSKRNDFIFLMAYDQHNAPALPGPVAGQKWVEEAMNEALKDIPAQKLILCVPTYGYDWPENCMGTPMSYQKAITKASQMGAKIDFDNNNYNLNYRYVDENNIPHKVFFTDAATNFNAIRASEDFGTAGVALWRLGSEDSRVWEFYARDLSFESLKEDKFNYRVLQNSKSTYHIDYAGAGEIFNVVSLPKDGKIKIEMTPEDELITEEKYMVLPTSCVVEKSGYRTEKWVAITFDDGPSDEYTPKILDILSKYHVRATFFIIGFNAEDNLPIVERIYREGHELGNHTFTHVNLAENGKERELLEIRSTNRIIQAVTGHTSTLFRSPYTSEPRSLDEFIPLYIARQEGFISVSSSYDPRDWEPNVTADTILKRVIEANKYGNIILLHDAGGNRSQTILALPRIIEHFQKEGYKFVSVADLMGKTRNDVMPPMPEDYMSFVNNTVVEATYYWENFLFALFLLALILSSGKLTILVVLAIINRIKETRINKRREAGPAVPLKVSIIVPAYNEEVNIEKSLQNLLKLDYPDFNVVFVDDGSKDSTYQRVYDKFHDNPRMKVFTKPNGGKASALNFGIEHADGEILVCIDADTLLKSDAITHLVHPFVEEEVGAVAGNVKVGNRINLLTNWQSIEYITSQNFDRRAFDLLNSIMVVPGAIGAFRREALLEIGGFTVDTLAEDCDLTLRLLSAGYTVRNCNEAMSYTEAPETLQMFIKQRFRWTFGIMQSFWKHKELLFNFKQPNLGWIILPNVLVFQMFLPLFSPIVDILMIYSIFTGNAGYVLEFYIAFLLFDSSISYMAFRFDKEKFTFKTFWLFALQRLIYRQLMWYVLVKAYNKAIKGEMAHWGVLKRTGNVKEKTE